MERREAACPIWVQGSLRGECIRKSLNLRSWEAASELVRGWEASGMIGVVKPDLPTVAEAVTKFFADATARQLSKSTISKQKNVLEKRLLSWCSKEGIRLLKQLDVDALRRFRATWPDSPITASRNLERLRNFFGFCLDAGWIPKNPAKGVRPPLWEVADHEKQVHQPVRARRVMLLRDSDTRVSEQNGYCLERHAFRQPTNGRRMRR